MKTVVRAFLFSIILLIFTLCGSTSSFLIQNIHAQNYESFKMKTIVIDAGHGGRPGAVVGSYKEKEITLAVALNLGKKIESAFPNINVIYTRTSDVDIELYRRSEIANNAGADLFISIHVNAATSTAATGTETFLMGPDKGSQNMEVAMKENQVVTFESDYKQKYEGFEPNSAESYILFSLMQYSYMSQSSLFASYIQDEYNKATTMPDRGVKQAPFLVLWRTTMPSVLTEIGFLSNAKDRAFVTSKTGQEKIATSIFNAFVRYKNNVEGGAHVSDITNIPPATAAKPTNSATSNGSSSSNRANYTNSTTNSSKIEFKIQVLAGSKKTELNSRNFGKYLSQVEVKKEDNLYKYYVVGCKNYKEALSLQIELKLFKYKDAFIVAYQGDKKITVSEALAITGM